MSKIILNGIEYSNGITYQELQPVIYSTEEREIGVWADGKPLYQKTILVTSIVSGNNTINHGISNVDKIVNAFGTFFSNANDSSLIPNGNLQTAWSVSMFNFGTTNFTISVGSSWVQYFDYIQVTIQYTKTTDTAGSGTWTPSGVPSVHYSTNEQVIGTWIDGKPRYEITLSGSGSYSAGSELVVPLPTNADKVVIMGGYVDIGTDWLPLSLTLGVGTGTTNGVYCYPNKSTGIHIYSSAWTFSEYNVTVQYCKTTD